MDLLDQEIKRLVSKIPSFRFSGDRRLLEKEYKLMKEGKWGNIDVFEKECQSKLHFIEELYTKTKLPLEPQGEKLRGLLAKILEEQYGSLAGAKQEFEYISSKDVMDMLLKIDKKLIKLSK